MIGGGNILGRFNARLGLDEKDYARGMINAQAANRIFGQTFTSFVSNPLLGSIQILKNVGGYLVRNSQETLAYAETIERLSQQTGASEGLLIALQKRLEVAGFTAERASQGMTFFNKFIEDYNSGGKLTNELVQQLGVSLNGLEGTDARFSAIVDALSKLPDPATRSAIAMQIFGRMGGPELINAIGGGSEAIAKMIDQYVRLGYVVDRNANSKLAALNTNLGIMQQAIDGVQASVVRELILAFTDTAEISDESIINLAASINEKLGPAARDFKVILEALLGVLEAVATTVGSIQNVGEEVFYNYFVASDRVESFVQSTDISPEARRIRAAQDRNRERGQEYLAEMGP
ncbi:MAG: hypothetical protein JJ916_10360 [Phycisphaerales bacterium]|nr:hypothetical protein [Phycisphaerales bacterium]